MIITNLFFYPAIELPLNSKFLFFIISILLFFKSTYSFLKRSFLSYYFDHCFMVSFRNTNSFSFEIKSISLSFLLYAFTLHDLTNPVSLHTIKLWKPLQSQSLVRPLKLQAYLTPYCTIPFVCTISSANLICPQSYSSAPLQDLNH